MKQSGRLNALQRALLLVNAISIDACLVVLGWQDLAAQLLKVPLVWHERLLLVLATWLVYAGDRLLDAHPLDVHHSIPRHRFTSRHFKTLTIAWFFGLITTIVLTLTTQEADRLIEVSLICLALAIYFGLCKIFPLARSLIPRELVVAIFALIAALYFPWSNRASIAFAGSPLTRYLLACLALVFLNCLAIGVWEVDDDRASGESTLATRYRVLADRFAVVCLGSGLLLTLCDRLSAGTWTTLGIASGMTASLFAVMHVSKLPTRLRPPAADLLLCLPPIIFRIVE